MDQPSSDSTRSSRREWFTTTHWSVVLAARQEDASRALAALEKLCRAYWYPLYVFARRSGYRPADAEDLVQGFLARCLEKNYFDAADERKGRFRSFLLIAFKRFLANEWDKARAARRGGAGKVFSLDSLGAEERYALEPADRLTADRLFERRWALTLLEQVLSRLQAEQAAVGRSAVFEQLKEYLTSSERGTPYSEVAERLGLSLTAVKVAVHRLRQRYRELLETEIAQTVGSPEDIAEERRHLLAALSG